MRSRAGLQQGTRRLRGAATCVAEHVPDDRGGFYVSFIQSRATSRFFLSLGSAPRAPTSALRNSASSADDCLSCSLRAARDLVVRAAAHERVAAVREEAERGQEERVTRINRQDAKSAKKTRRARAGSMIALLPAGYDGDPPGGSQRIQTALWQANERRTRATAVNRGART